MKKVTTGRNNYNVSSKVELPNSDSPPRDVFSEEFETAHANQYSTDNVLVASTKPASVVDIRSPTGFNDFGHESRQCYESRQSEYRYVLRGPSYTELVETDFTEGGNTDSAYASELPSRAISRPQSEEANIVRNAQITQPVPKYDDQCISVGPLGPIPSPVCVPARPDQIQDGAELEEEYSRVQEPRTSPADSEYAGAASLESSQAQETNIVPSASSSTSDNDSSSGFQDEVKPMEYCTQNLLQSPTRSLDADLARPLRKVKSWPGDQRSDHRDNSKDRFGRLTLSRDGSFRESFHESIFSPLLDAGPFQWRAEHHYGSDGSHISRSSAASSWTVPIFRYQTTGSGTSNGSSGNASSPLRSSYDSQGSSLNSLSKRKIGSGKEEDEENADDQRKRNIRKPPNPHLPITGFGIAKFTIQVPCFVDNCSGKDAHISELMLVLTNVMFALCRLLG